MSKGSKKENHEMTKEKNNMADAKSFQFQIMQLENDKDHLNNEIKFLRTSIFNHFIMFYLFIHFVICN